VRLFSGEVVAEVFREREGEHGDVRVGARLRLGLGVGVRVRLGVLLFCLVVCVVWCLMLGAEVVRGATGGSVWWGVSSSGSPSVLLQGRVGEVVLSVQDLGDVATSSTVSVEDHLPVGLHAIGITGKAGGNAADFRGPLKCSLGKLSCSYGLFEENVKHEVIENPKKELVEVLPAYELIEVRIKVEVSGSAESGQNRVVVSGGGASREADVSSPIEVGSTSPTFGVEQYGLVPEEEGGGIDTQAGSHPFQLTTTLLFNNKGLNNGGLPEAVGLPKNIIDELPAGLIGDPTPFAQCTDAQFASVPANASEETEFEVNECPADSAIGVATVQFTDPAQAYQAVTAPVFNVTPLPGEPARFGFKAGGIVSAFLDTSVRTGGDYGVTVISENITEAASVLSVHLTFWGVPGDPRHDRSRGWECMDHFGFCPTTRSSVQPPFLEMPTSCETGLASTIRMVSWPAEGKPSLEAGPVTFQPDEGVDGCDRLPFAPEVRVTPDGTAASTPTGLAVDVHVPQSAVLNGNSLADAAVRSINVVLPEGVAINPAGGDGLEACAEGLVGYLPAESTPPTRVAFTPTIGEPFCPDASKVATVKIKTPILPNPLEGALYLATQNENPFGSLLAMYLVARDPVSGVLVKLAGRTSLSSTGQITGTFEDSPQAPFEDAELDFFGGERAPLATPAHCGAYTTNATFTPWSGTEPVKASSTFELTRGPNNSPCPGSVLPFAPTFTGGTLNIQAGAFTQLTTTLNREDGEQNLQSVQLHMPPGLSGILTGVKLCPEQQANEGTCPPESLIGETTVSAGVGSDPVTVKGGKVYLTETYDGAPFGLSIVNPVKAGPFDLEHDTANPAQDPACDCLVVRASIQVDPRTAALTVTTDANGPRAIPSFVDGIPVEIKKVNVLINRPSFSFNPTNCAPMSITTTITSTEHESRTTNTPFQVTNCATLNFNPHFSAETNNKTSRADGASLNVRLTYPSAPQDTQANIAYTRVQLPRQLPSRLSTLQKACLAKIFNTNPAECPPASLVGTAKATTPLLPVPLQGPAYFVSNGSAEFPNLVIVLQGYGITIQLIGETNIKNEVTTSTFPAIPDAPVGTFELNLPTGRYSALGTTTNLCTQTLTMPTTFKAQNGTQLTQNTPITVTGCKPLTIISHTQTKNKIRITLKTTTTGTLTISSKNSKTHKQPLTTGTHTITITLHHPHKPTTIKLKLQTPHNTTTTTTTIKTK
jgi:hypothetical protein